MKGRLIISCIIIVFIACGTVAVLQPGSNELASMRTKVPDMTLENAIKGFQLYKQNCSGCHRLHRPAEYTSAEWNKNLLEMFPKAKLTDSVQKALIKDYLSSLSK